MQLNRDHLLKKLIVCNRWEANSSFKTVYALIQSRVFQDPMMMFMIENVYLDITVNPKSHLKASLNYFGKPLMILLFKF